MSISNIYAVNAYLESKHLESKLKAELEPIVQAAKMGDQTAINDINDRFFESLTFGTGGMRGLMGAGLRRINKPNVRRVTLALAQVTKKYAPNSNIALVGFDTRLESDVLAMETARVLASVGYKVYLGSKPLPTPFLCYAMRKISTACSVIITASHNPKNYNGYKAYNNNGGQVLSPWDQDIEAVMNQLPLVPIQTSTKHDSNILPIPQWLEESYINLGLNQRQSPKCFEQANILYTPFHGTGIAFVPELYKRAGLKLQICTAQATQDGNFPTAPRPNPEEEAAYKIPIINAQQINADAIISNDPDADRIGLVAPNNDKWELMNGNDLVAITLDYLCCQKGLKGVLVTTVVTSDFVSKVAQYYGLETMWTLTGFKYIALAMDTLSKNLDHFAFGAEESFGMQLTDEMRDKDGVIAALLVGEMIGYYKALNMGPFEAVSQLKQKVGIFHNRLVNIENHSSEGIKHFKEAMTKMRQNNLTEIAGEKICLLEDFETGMWHSKEGKTGLILDRLNSNIEAKPIKRSNVLKIRLQSGAFIAFRPSGTEPKLKIYLQSCTTIKFLDKMEIEARKLLSL